MEFYGRGKTTDYYSDFRYMHLTTDEIDQILERTNCQSRRR